MFNIDAGVNKREPERTIGGKGQTFLKKIQSPKEDFLPTLSERYDMSAENPSCQCTNCVMSGDKYKHLI
jgi:hypothetical protein